MYVYLQCNKESCILTSHFMALTPKKNAIGIPSNTKGYAALLALLPILHNTFPHQHHSLLIDIHERMEWAIIKGERK